MSRKQQIALLIALLSIGGLIWGLEYWPTSSRTAGNGGFLRGYQTLNFPNSNLDWSIVDTRHKAEYKGTGINPFSYEGPKPPAPPPPKVPKPGDKDYVAPVIPPPPPPELPANMKFFGYGTVPNGTPRRAFLSYQDDVYIVSEGDMLIGRYKIVRINNASLEFEEVSSGRHGQKMLEDQGQQSPNA